MNCFERGFAVGFAATDRGCNCARSTAVLRRVPRSRCSPKRNAGPLASSIDSVGRARVGVDRRFARDDLRGGKGARAQRRERPLLRGAPCCLPEYFARRAGPIRRAVSRWPRSRAARRRSPDRSPRSSPLVIRVGSPGVTVMRDDWRLRVRDPSRRRPRRKIALRRRGVARFRPAPRARGDRAARASCRRSSASARAPRCARSPP